jgi:hypothetical protein
MLISRSFIYDEAYTSEVLQTHCQSDYKTHQFCSILIDDIVLVVIYGLLIEVLPAI